MYFPILFIDRGNQSRPSFGLPLLFCGGILMKILSLDQSTVATGWAYFSSNSLVQHGVIHINSKNKALPKWIMMMNDICNLIDAYCPNIVIIEDTIMQKSTNTLKELTRLQGALIWYCFLKKLKLQRCIPVIGAKLLICQ